MFADRGPQQQAVGFDHGDTLTPPKFLGPRGSYYRAQEQPVSEAAFQPIIGCFGDPLSGNPMQLLVERAFHAAGLDWRFLSLEVPADKFEAAVRGAQAMRFRGAAFTTPHQVAVIPLLDRLTPEAAAIGAVNCAVRINEEWVGDNTDGRGFMMSLEPLIDPADRSMVVLGAGGTARAVAIELAKKKPASITIVNRTIERASELVQTITEQYQIESHAVAWQTGWTVPSETSLLVHATTRGWCDPDDGPELDWSAANSELVVADVIFNPPDSQLLVESRRRGFRTLSGIDMMAHQVSLAYRLWTGSDPAEGVIHETLEEYLEV